MCYNESMWVGDQYFYTKRTLRTIAKNYTGLYDGLPSFRGQITNPWSLAEYKADFDMALNSIGKGKWTGIAGKFKDYRYHGRLQQIIIADILGMENYELEGLGFYNCPRLRGYGYYLMTKYLNGE